MKAFFRIAGIFLASLLASSAATARPAPSSGVRSQEPAKPAPENPLVKAFTEGNLALVAHRYNDAISAYDRCIALDPGQYPVWINRAAALRERGAERFNQYRAGGEKDAAGAAAAEKDWVAAIEASERALTLMDAIKPAPPPAPGQNADAALAENRLAALEKKAECLFLIAGYMHKERYAEAVVAYHAASEFAKDPKKKNQLRNKEAQATTVNGDLGPSLVIYKSVLESDPVNLDALYGALMAACVVPDWKNARDFADRFLKAAPANDRRRADIQQLMDSLPELRKPG